MENNLEQRIRLLTDILKQKRVTMLAHEQYLSKTREYVPGENLYMREVHFVMAVGPGAGCLMTALAQKLDVTPGAVSQLATRLEKKGYIQRSQCEDDRRQIVATLTPKGEALYLAHEEYDREHYIQISDYLNSFTDEQLLTCMEYEKAVQNIFETAMNQAKSR